MSIKDKIKNWLNAKNPAKFNLKNIIAYIRGTWRKNHIESTPEHILEQAAFRKAQTDPECISLTYCKNCGCDLEGKQLENSGCEWGCWFNLMDKKDWEQYKLYLEKHKTN